MAKGLKLKNPKGEEREYYLFQVTVTRNFKRGYDYYIIGTEVEEFKRDIIMCFENDVEGAIKKYEELQTKALEIYRKSLLEEE